jgi:SAM-dependent methyltransferase
MQSLSQDALLAGAKGHDVEFIGGGVDSIECESNSVDVVTCHHSVEHFQGAVDTAFVAESLRVLKPGGLLIVAPLFVAQHHGEYANTRSIADSTGGILDRTAAFAGWGPYEGFARVYSPETLERRLIAPATGLNASVSIIRLVVDGADVPDLVANRHQVKINRPLRALVIQKSR